MRFLLGSSEFLGKTLSTFNPYNVSNSYALYRLSVLITTSNTGTTISIASIRVNINSQYHYHKGGRLYYNIEESKQLYLPSTNGE